MLRVGETRFQGTTMLLKWDKARHGKEGVRQKGRSLRLKSNASYVTVHIGHGIVQKESAQCPMP